MLGDRESAEDAAQETFLRAFRHLHRYDPDRSFATWLLSIAAHYCIDRLRRVRFTLVPLDPEDSDGTPRELPDASAPNPEAEAIRTEERRHIQALLDHLDGIDRAAITMRYWQGLSEVEIAEALHLTVSAVKSRLHRARRELASRWKQDTPRLQPRRRTYESSAF
jgi:RNA polymerase sigma-70 factor (ECF subfamily)